MSETRDLRFSVRPSVHAQVRTLRARTNKTNEELLTDMVRVYAANPKLWQLDTDTRSKAQAKAK